MRCIHKIMEPLYINIHQAMQSSTRMNDMFNYSLFQVS